MERLVRLHLGSGRHYWPGFINVDLDPRADIVCNVTDLSNWEDGTVDEIYAIHLFEHIHRMDAMGALEEWNRVLKPGGKLVLEVPSLDKIAKMIAVGTNHPSMTLFGIFGDVRERNPLMEHHWCYTEAELSHIMQEAGFDVEAGDPAYHVKVRDMRLTGVKK